MALESAFVSYLLLVLTGYLRVHKVPLVLSRGQHPLEAGRFARTNKSCVVCPARTVWTMRQTEGCVHHECRPRIEFDGLFKHLIKEYWLASRCRLPVLSDKQSTHLDMMDAIDPELTQSIPSDQEQ